MVLVEPAADVTSQRGIRREFQKRLVVVARLRIGGAVVGVETAERQVGRNVVGISREDLFELRDGVIGVALFLQQDRIVETGVAGIRVGHERQFVILHRPLGLTGSAVGDAEVVVRLKERWVGGNSPSVVGNRRSGLALLVFYTFVVVSRRFRAITGLQHLASKGSAHFFNRRRRWRR